MDCSDAFYTIDRAAALAMVATYGERPAGVTFRMDSGDNRAITCTRGVKRGRPVGPVKFCASLHPGLNCFHRDFEGREIEAFACMDDTTLGLLGVTAIAVRTMPLHKRLTRLVELLSPPYPWRYL